MAEIDARKWNQPAPDQVRGLIGDSGLTQVEVAKRLGVSPRALRNWIEPANGTTAGDGRRIKYAQWVALCLLCGKN